MRAILLYALCSLLYALASAQEYRLIPPQYEIEHVNLGISEDAGLFVNMLEDKEGYLWIATTKGLLVFDGHESILYRASDPRLPMAISSNGVGAFGLERDKDGMMYTDHAEQPKIARFDPVQRKVLLTYDPSEISVPRTYFQVSEEGEVYSIHWSKSVDTCSLWKLNTSDPHQRCFQYSTAEVGTPLSYRYSGHHHWLQTSHGLWRISKDGTQSDFHKYPDKSSVAAAIPFDNGNAYFTYRQSDAIFSWNATDDKPGIYTRVPQDWIENTNGFIVDGSRIFMASSIALFVADTLQRTLQDLSEIFYQLKVTRVQGAMAEDIYAIKKIDEQIYILGGKNLYRLREKSPGVATFRESLPGADVIHSMRGITQDDKFNVYACDYGNVYVKPANSDVFRDFLPLSEKAGELQSAFSLNCYNGQLLWNTMSVHIASGTMRQIGGDVSRGHVVHMLSGDTLWMYIWNTNKFYLCDLSSGAMDSVEIERSKAVPDFPYMINEMIQDHVPSQMWIATRSDGICLMDKQGRLIQKHGHEELGAGVDEGICDLYLEGNDLWYGCLNGLGVLDIRSGEHRMYSNPVINLDGVSKNRTIYSMLPDDRDGFYLGSNSGLLYFDRSDKTFYNLSDDHPLAQNEFNRASAFMDESGRYYFGTTDGLFSFLPDELVFHPAADSLDALKLLGISIFNGSEKNYRYLSESMNTLKELRLRPSDTNLRFSFSVPDFEKNVYYSYRVSGLDEQWSPYTLNNEVLLYALPFGAYHLEVKASSNSSDANASFYALQIHMPQVWYRKAWVIILMSLVFTGIVVMLIRYRFRQKWLRQQALEKLRVNISSDLHDDVGSLLSGVAMQSQVMSYDVDDRHKSSMLELSAMSREAMERMRDTVWAIDARKDKYENLIDRMRDFAEKTLERKNITHEFITKDIDGKKFINPEVRQNIYLIFKEAITNVVKHSDGNHVRVEMSQDARGLHLVVHDNGSQKAMNNSDGLGISNIQMRANKIGGKCELKYEDGYRVELKV